MYNMYVYVLLNMSIRLFIAILYASLEWIQFYIFLLFKIQFSEFR